VNGKIVIDVNIAGDVDIVDVNVVCIVEKSAEVLAFDIWVVWTVVSDWTKSVGEFGSWIQVSCVDTRISNVVEINAMNWLNVSEIDVARIVKISVLTTGIVTRIDVVITVIVGLVVVILVDVDKVWFPCLWEVGWEEGAHVRVDWVGYLCQVSQ